MNTVSPMNSSFKKLISQTIFLFAAILLLTTFARAELLPIKTYTSADGLIYEKVRRVYQDSRGFMWFITPVGVSRYDGYQFVNYGIEDGFDNPLTTDMVEDNKGIYWFGTNGGGVYRFDPAANTQDGQNGKHKKFGHFTLSEQENDNSILKIHKTRNGEVFFGTYGGLFILNEREESKFSRIELNTPTTENLFVNAIAEDQEGSLWIGHQFGFSRRLPDKTIIHYRTNSAGKPERIRSLSVDPQNRIWLVDESRHLIVFYPEPIAAIDKSDSSVRQMRFQDAVDRTTNIKQGFAYQFKSEESPVDGSFSWVKATSDGKIWITTIEKGLAEFENGKFNLYTQKNGLSDNAVSSVTEDNYGNLWFGSEWGVMRLAKTGFITYNRDDGLASEVVVKILEDRDGSLYIVNANWTVNKFIDKNFVPVRLNLPAFSGAWINHEIFLTRAGEWLAGTPNGLYKFAASEHFANLAKTQPSAIYTTKQGLPYDDVLAVFEDSGGNIWVSFSERKGLLARLPQGENNFQTMTVQDGLPENCQPVNFREDTAGNIYIACSFENIVIYRNGKFSAFQSEFLPKNWRIGDILLDRKSRLWVAASTTGLVKIENLIAGNPSARAYTTADGLSSIHVQFITEDISGKIYFVTSRGMDVLDPDTGNVKQYTIADGLAAGGTGAALRDRNGDLWFGAHRGVSKFTPEPEKIKQSPPVYISALRIAGRPHPISANGETDISGLTLEPDERQMQIDFLALNLVTGDPLRFQYKLEGADTDWSEPTDQRTANYPNIAAGNYRFLVRAVRSDGSVSESPAAISFSVLRPFWQRWWFLLLMTILFSAIIYAIYRYRIAQVIKLERVRTRIATDLHDDIGASLSKIAILSEVVSQRVAPVAPGNTEISEPLTQIAGTSREMVDSMSDIVWAINPQRDHLNDLLQRMQNLAGEMSELRDIELDVDFINLENSNWHLSVDLRRETYLIFKEAINNMVKHSNCEEAQIRFELTGDSLLIEIKDDGDGFDVRKRTTENQNGRGGNGLINMQKRAEALGGNCLIESEIGKGTTVALSVPLKNRFSFVKLFSGDQKK